MKNKLKSIFLFAIFLLIISACSNDADKNSTVKSNSGKTEQRPKEKIVSVEIMKIKKESVQQKITYTAIASAINTVDIVAEVSGKVIESKKSLGEYITKKDILAVIDFTIPKSNYEQAKAQVISAENNLNVTKLNFSSDSTLYASNDISEFAFKNSASQLKNAQAQLLSAKAQLSVAKKSFEDTKIKSPINGFIARKYIEIGTMINPGTPIYRVVDLSKIKLNFGVPQSVVSQIKIGSKAKLHFSSVNNLTLNGIVKFISPQANEKTGTFEIEIQADNTNNIVRAGFTSKVTLFLTTPENRITVPDYAVINKAEDTYVYVVKNKKAILTKVKLDGRFGDRVIVENGLSEGDIIVIGGMKNLGINTKIKIGI